MSYVNRKSKFSMLLMASLIATNFAFAADSYKNNVVDVKVNKEPGNAVKVTIYTDKPYTDPVVVNKKANNKYVILMPETNSSLKTSPSVSEVAGTVSNVSVNTQSVSGGKGYTKIIITSEKAITVVPRTQQLSSNLAKNSNVNTQKEALAKKAAEEKAQREKAQKLAQEKAQKEALAKKAAEEKAQREKAQKLAQEKAQKEALARKAAAEKAQREKARKLAQEREAKNQQSVAVNNNQISHNSNSYNHPIEVLENEVKTNKTANISSEIPNDDFLKREINDNLAKQNKQELNSKELKPSAISSIKSLLSNHDNFSLWKLLLLASAITFPIIVIMLILGMDKKINKKIAMSFRKEEPQPMKSDINYIQNEINNNSTVYDTIDDMLSRVDEPTPTYHEEQIMRSNLEQQVSEVQDTINSVQFENDFESGDFDNTDNIVEEMNENNMTLSDEFVSQSPIDVVEQVPENIDKTHVAQEQSAEVVPVSDYSPDGYLADFSNVDDKEFFDEIVIQSLANSNSGGLPDELPEDKIFNNMDSVLMDETPINTEKVDMSQPVSKYNDNVEIAGKNVDNIADAESVDYIDNTVGTVSHQEEELPKSDDGYSTNVIEEIESDKELIMLNQVEINNRSGLYLVDYDDFSALVGYVGENYFVLKKFAEHITSKIVLKPTEQLANSMRYLVRVGKDKMIVEVGDSSMSRLLDL